MSAAKAKSQRLAYMDNLRALAMLVGVVFHTSLAYSPLLHDFWPTADAEKSRMVDAVAWFSHLFRMPLFFVIAGFFVALLVGKVGTIAMLRHRVMRVGVPFLLFWPLIYFSLSLLTTYAANNVLNLSPMLRHVEQWLATANRQTPWPSLMHLWFLPYLMCFCVLVWVAKTLEISGLAQRFATLPPWVLIAVVPLVLVVPLASVAAPVPAPESIFPQWWALVFFGCYFLFGYQLFAHQPLIEKLQRFAPWLLLGGLGLYAAFYWLLSVGNLFQFKPMLHIVKAVLEAYAGAWMTLWCLIAGRLWLNTSNQFLRYLANASYWVYLVHLPILFAIQYSLLDVEAPWMAKFIASTIATLIICFISYQLLVRHTVLGTLLNGRRQGVN